MKRVIIVCILITTLLYGCAAKVIKAPADGVSSSTKNSNVETPPKADTTTTATASSKTTAPKTVEINNEGSQYYTARPVNVSKDDWLSDLAGGRKNSIKVRIGEVTPSNSAGDAEVYIELEGKGDKLTLVANGIRNEYDDSTRQLKRRVINFLTGKRLVGKEVIKDYSEGKDKIILIVDYDVNGTSLPSVMFCPQGDSEDNPKNNFYKLEVND